MVLARTQGGSHSASQVKNLDTIMIAFGTRNQQTCAMTYSTAPASTSIRCGAQMARSACNGGATYTLVGSLCLKVSALKGGLGAVPAAGRWTSEVQLLFQLINGTGMIASAPSGSPWNQVTTASPLQPELCKGSHLRFIIPVPSPTSEESGDTFSVSKMATTGRFTSPSARERRIPKLKIVNSRRL